MTETKKLVAKVISLVTLAVIITLGLVSFALAKKDVRTYPSNVTVGGVSLAGLDKKEASDFLENSIREKFGDNLVFQLDGEAISIPLEEYGISFDLKASIEKVDNCLYKDDKTTDLFHHILIRGKKQTIAPAFSLDEDLIRQKMMEFKMEHDRPAVDARILYKDGYLEYIAHKYGYSIDLDKSIKNLYDALESGSLNSIEILLKDISPRVKLEDIKAVRDVLGVNASVYEFLSPEAETVISSLNGLIIMPGEIFKLDDIVPNTDAGGNDAVNRIAKMLNKAFLQAGLRVEGSPVELKNDLKTPVLLTAVLQDRTLLIRIFGCQTQMGKEICIIIEKEEVLPEVSIVIKAGLSPEQRIIKQEGESSYINRTYRVVKENEQEIEKTLLSEDYIPGRDTIILVGRGNINK